MQHAEAHERLSDLALEPGRLARLDDDRSPDGEALRVHVAACRACAGDLASWRRTWASLGVALSGTRPIDDEAGTAHMALDTPDVLRAPASLRARTLAAVAAEGRARLDPVPSVLAPARTNTTAPSGADARVAEPGRVARDGARTRRRRVSVPRPSMPWLAAAAALVIALGAGSLAWSQAGDLERAHSENAGLAATTAALDRVLATPIHWVVTLRAPDGTAGGTVAWTGSEIAVITSALPAPSVGQAYRCWVERDGVRTPVGPMWFSGSTGYWAGSMDGWGGLLSPGARFGVSLAPADGSPATPMLVGTI